MPPEAKRLRMSAAESETQDEEVTPTEPSTPRMQERQGMQPQTPPMEEDLQEVLDAVPLGARHQAPGAGPGRRRDYLQNFAKVR